MNSDKVIIEVENIYSKLITSDGQIITAVYNALSCIVDNYWFSPAYKMGRWDGKQRFFNKSTKKFPTGLISKVLEVVKLYELEYVIVDKRINSSRILPQSHLSEITLNNEKSLRCYQVDAVNTIINNKLDGSVLFQRGIINIATNGGKAQPLYAKVLTPTGFSTMGDLQVGDSVIGDDGLPHRILKIFDHELKNIYEVTLNDGSKTRCCDEHLWAVQNDTDRNKNRYRVKDLREIMTSLTYGKKDVRPNWSIPVVKPVELAYQKVELDPWLMGFLIGDGSFADGSLGFSTAESDILNRVTQLAISYGDEVKQHSGDNYCDFRIVGNHIRRILYNYGLMNHRSYEKFIPKPYIINTSKIRLEVLRGLNDSDGYVDANKSGYVEYSTTSLQLSHDVKFIVESLGGATYSSNRLGRYTNYNGDNIETRLQYSVGERFFNKEVIPVSSEKHSNKWVPRKKGCYKYITSIDFIGKEPARCIYIDNPTHLYITDDFIVTHNTTIAESIIDQAYDNLTGNQCILFITHSKEIAQQTKKSFEADLGIDVGMVGDGKWVMKKVTIALVSTLHSRMKRKHETFQYIVDNTVAFIGDEIHHSSSTSWYEVLNQLENAVIRIGLTGTVTKENEEKRMRLFSVCGDILIKISNDYLIKQGFSAKPECKLIRVDYPDIDKHMRYYGQTGTAGELTYQDAYQKGIVSNAYRNYLIAKICELETSQNNGQLLILVEHVEHGVAIQDMIDIIDSGIRCIFLHGELKSEERQTGLELLKSGDVDVVVSTSILDEGVDVPNINAVIYARGGKSIRKLLQGIGRGLRKKEDGSTLRFYDFIDDTSVYLLEHSLKRYKTLKKEKFEIVEMNLTDDLGLSSQEYDDFMSNYDDAFDDEIFVYVDNA